MIKETLAKELKLILKTKHEGLHPMCVFDRCLRQEGIAEELLKYLGEDIDNGIVPENVTVVCSGRFGEYVKKIFETKFTVIHADGGLRDKDSKPPDFDRYKDLMDDAKCVFVDDSIHTCRTQTRIMRAVEKQNGKIVAAYYGFIAGKSPWIRRVRGILSKEEVRDGS